MPRESRSDLRGSSAIDRYCHIENHDPAFSRARPDLRSRRRSGSGRRGHGGHCSRPGRDRARLRHRRGPSAGGAGPVPRPSPDRPSGVRGRSDPAGTGSHAVLRPADVHVGPLLLPDLPQRRDGSVDALPTSIEHGWKKGPRNAPSVHNALLMPPSSGTGARPTWPSRRQAPCRPRSK